MEYNATGMDYPELEGNSSIDDIVSEEDVTSVDMQEQMEGNNENNENNENNCLDVTFINEEDQPMNYDGIEENHHHHNHEGYTSTFALKRNLSAAFEKHATTDEGSKTKKKFARKVKVGGFQSEKASTSSVSSSSSSFNGVKAKIKAFEQKKIVIKPKDNSNNNKARFDNASRSRPPTAPIPQRTTSVDSKNSSDEHLLSVYLRIRPPYASQDAISECEEVGFNTVEVLPPAPNDEKSTTIRTYPPIQSNAAKVVRGQSQLHSTSNNTDLIFNGSNKNVVDSAVKGVKEFNFDQVFSLDSSQEEVYQNITIPLVDGLFPKDQSKLVGDKLVGKSALLFSYGITNAGKTHTIIGQQSTKNHDVRLEESHGIIPRTIDHMLSKIKAMETDNVKYQLNLSYLEIYNEQIYDLLPIEERKADATTGLKYPGGPRAFPTDQAPLRIRESKNSRIYVRGLAKHHVASFARGLELVSKAKNKRRTSSNSINSDSSRSHSICQFELVAVPASLNNEMNDVDNVSVSTSTSSLGYNTDDDNSVQSKISQKRSVTFWVVDLAGSERSKRTGAFSRSTRQKEAALINSSLMKLMRCLQTLRHNQTSNYNASVVPFRESKLTHLFMGHLTSSSASRTSMIVNINPSIADFDETQHVLSYATVARSIRISQTDYNRKRQAIQMIGTDATVSTNGGKQKAGFKSPPRKIARMVQKLSPRAALARMKEQQKSNHVKRKEELEALRGSKNVGDNAMKKKDFGKGRLGRNRQEQLNELRSELEKSQAETEKYKMEANELRNQLAQCEADIRKEIYEETEQYHKCIHDQHNEIVNRLKQQIAAAAQTPSKSAMKVQRDRADIMIDELMDKVDECEEEMERMAESHKEEILSLTETNSLELLKKDEELEELKNKLEQTIQDSNREIELLKAELLSQSEITEELPEEDDGNDEEEQSSCEKENDVNYTGPSPRLRRLPRKRCSEVACANISPPTEIPSSSSKKQRKKGLANKRSPFKNKNGRPTTNNEILIKKSPQRGENSSDLSKEIIFPSVKAEYDELTGSYHRPVGRAPSNRIWDATAGGWRVSRAGMQ